LFYKESVESEDDKTKDKDELVLDFLPQIKEKINGNTDVFEIEFFSPFEEKEIYTLLGCLNLRLLNINFEFVDENCKSKKFKVKFYPNVFEKQINFLQKIQKMLSNIGINFIY
jgi:hypothetical protein